MVEAVGYVRESGLASAADRRYELLKMAHDRLVAIVGRYPSTDLAVTLATGQRVGTLSLDAVRTAMDEALSAAMNPSRPAAPSRPGAPLRAWQLEADVVALGLPPGKPWAWMVSRDGVTSLRDFGTGDVLHSWRGAGRATAAALSPDGERILTAFVEENAVVLRDSETGRVLRQWAHNWPISSVALSWDGGTALVGTLEAMLIDVVALSVRGAWSGRGEATAVARSPDGRLVLAGFADGTAVLGDAASERVLYKWTHPGSGAGGIGGAAFSADGRRVLVGAANYRAVLRDTGTGTTLREWDAGHRVTAVALSRDGQWALTGDNGWEVELHDARTGRTVRKWRYDSRPTAVAFSADGRQALMGFRDGAAILCDIRLPESRRRYVRTYLSADGGCW